MFTEQSSWTLQSNVVGPLDKAGEVLFGLDILSNAKILGPFLGQGIEHILGLLLLHHRGFGATFFPFAFLLSASRVAGGESSIVSLDHGGGKGTLSR